MFKDTEVILNNIPYTFCKESRAALILILDIAMISARKQVSDYISLHLKISDVSTALQDLDLSIFYYSTLQNKWHKYV